MSTIDTNSTYYFKITTPISTVDASSGSTAHATSAFTFVPMYEGQSEPTLDFAKVTQVEAYSSRVSPDGTQERSITTNGSAIYSYLLGLFPDEFGTPETLQIDIIAVKQSTGNIYFKTYGQVYTNVNIILIMEE